MAFEEELNVEINSVFNARGFRQLERRMNSVRRNLGGLSQVFNDAEKQAGRQKFLSEFQNRLDETSLRLENFREEFFKGSRAGFFNFESTPGAANFDSLGEAAAAAREQVRELGGVVVDENNNIARMGRLVDGLSDTFMDSQPLANRGFSENVTNNTLENLIPSDMENPFSGGDGDRGFLNEAVRRAGFSETVSSIPGAGDELEVLNEQTNLSEENLRKNRSVLTSLSMAFDELVGRTGDSNERFTRGNTLTQRMSEAFEIARLRMAGFEGGVRSLLPNLQALQMELLGVQFQLLTLAFILGGALLPALGAVGIFEILGNTLKLLFLPTALDLIPVVLDIRDALLSLSDEAREAIGRFLIIGAAITGFGSLLAFFANGLLSVASAARIVTAPLTKLINTLLFFKTGSTGFAALKGLGSGGAVGGLRALGSAASKIALPLTLLLGILSGLTAVVQRFPEARKTTLKFASSLGFLGDLAQTTLENILLIGKGFINVFQGIFTFFAAKLFNDPDKQVKGASEFAKGLSQIFVEPFFNFIDGLGDKVLEKGVKLGASFLKGFFGAFTGQDKGIFKTALKTVLPTGVFNVVDTFFDFSKTNKKLNDILETNVNNLDVEPADFSIGQDFQPESTLEQKNQKVNNMFDITTGDFKLDETDQTPLQAGRDFGRGFAQENLNRRSSIFASGT